MEKSLNSGCILILGAPNDNKGNLSLIAKSRLKLGAQELAVNTGFKILLTGGFGQHFNQTDHPHWFYAKDFLIKEHSISPKSFLPEAIDSTNTIEDIEMARPIIEKYNFSKIVIVTSEFHLKRVQYVAEKVFNLQKLIVLYSFVPDKELDQSILTALYDHEKKALDYLQLKY
jgi:hypothetical protein